MKKRLPMGMMLIILGLIISPLGSEQIDLSPVQILERLDRNEGYASSHSKGTILVEDRRGIKTTGFESWTQGRDKSLIVFTSGEERGQKIFRLPEAMYLSYPDADKPFKIQGAVLRDSVAGSDFSYEDMAGDRSWSGRYIPNIVKTETLRGRACTVLELNAKEEGQAYPMVRIWVSQDDFTGIKLEKYSKNKQLLKIQEVEAFLTVKNRKIPSRIIMVDIKKAKNRTVLAIDSLEVDIAIPKDLMSLGALQ